MSCWRDIRAGVAFLGFALALAARPALGADAAAEFAEGLVRTTWFEGIPYAEAQRLGPVGVQRVIELLEDPAEAEHHANAVMALGMSGSPQAYPALMRFAGREPRGEIGRAEYRARNALPFALGHLARSDRRALRLLEQGLASGAAPAWSYRHLAGERLRAQLERSTVTALGMSGLPEAETALETASRRAAGARDAGLESHIGEARALRARVARDGPARVFGRGN